MSDQRIVQGTVGADRLTQVCEALRLREASGNNVLSPALHSLCKFIANNTELQVDDTLFSAVLAIADARDNAMGEGRGISSANALLLIMYSYPELSLHMALLAMWVHDITFFSPIPDQVSMWSLDVATGDVSAMIRSAGMLSTLPKHITASSAPNYCSVPMLEAWVAGIMLEHKHNGGK